MEVPGAKGRGIQQGEGHKVRGGAYSKYLPHYLISRHVVTGFG